MSVSVTPQKRSTADRLLKLAKSRTVLRARDVADLGIHTGTVPRMARAGESERVGPGRYKLPARRRATEYHDLVVATSAIPRSVVCLVSALRFHSIGTQLPHQVWIADAVKA